MTHGETPGAGPTQTVAVLGAGGTMGLAMARNIARAGIEVRAWNRSRDKAEPLADDGAYIAATPAEAGCMALARRYGVGFVDAPVLGTFVDAPVLGTRQPAEQGKLVVLESGPEEARPRVQPVFDAIGHRTVRAGQAGAGTRLKLVTNSWVLAVVEAGAETIALAEGLGVDPSLFFQAVEGGPLDLPYLRVKGQAMTERDFTPAFRLSLAAKHGDEDISATYLTSAPEQAA